MQEGPEPSRWAVNHVRLVGWWLTVGRWQSTDICWWSTPRHTKGGSRVFNGGGGSTELPKPGVGGFGKRAEWTGPLSTYYEL